jgi:hypothetical protein
VNKEEYQRKWRTEHKEYFKKYNVEWKKKNRVVSNKYREKWTMNVYNETRKKILEKFGNQCVMCGFNDVRALQIDHVNGGGRKEIKGMSPVSYLKKVLGDKDGHYQVLCANCNFIKRYTNNEKGY